MFAEIPRVARDPISLQKAKLFQRNLITRGPADIIQDLDQGPPKIRTLHRHG